MSSKSHILELTCIEARSVTRSIIAGNEPPSSSNIKTHFLLVALGDIPDSIPMDPNPRVADLQAKPCIDMKKTLDNKVEFQYFTDFNRGLLLLAERAYYTDENGKKKIVIDFGLDSENGVVGGLVDGGHTYAVLEVYKKKEYLKKLPIWITVIEGADQEHASGIARARNTSVQVKDYSIKNRDSEFEDMKKALGKYAKRVIFYENEQLVNEDAVVPVQEVIALMTAMNKELYGVSQQPTVAYSGLNSCYKKWADERIRETYKKFYHLLPDFLELYEHLYSHFELYLKTNHEKMRMRANGIVNDVINELPFTKVVVNYELAKGFVLPIFAALRVLLEKNHDGIYSWMEDQNPVEFLDKHGPKLVEAVINAHRTDYAGNPNKTGKSRVLWENIVGLINSALLEDLRRQIQ